VVLTATATLPGCYASASVVDFTWTHVSTSRMPHAKTDLDLPSLNLDNKTRYKSELTLHGKDLVVGGRYLLRLTACLHDLPGSCGYAETEVTLSDEKLVAVITGGHRRVGHESGLTLDACSSYDPDDAAARCDSTRNCGSLLFAWMCYKCDGVGDDAEICTPCGDNPAPPLPSGSCTWSIAPFVLDTSNYTFVAVVMSSTAMAASEAEEMDEGAEDGEEGEGSAGLEYAIAVIEVVEGNLPSVEIIAPAEAGITLEQLKQNPDKKLPLQAVGSINGIDNPSFTYEWTAVAEAEPDASPDLFIVSSTGPNEELLVNHYDHHGHNEPGTVGW